MPQVFIGGLFLVNISLIGINRSSGKFIGGSDATHAKHVSGELAKLLENNASKL